MKTLLILLCGLSLVSFAEPVQDDAFSESGYSTHSNEASAETEAISDQADDFSSEESEAFSADEPAQEPINTVQEQSRLESYNQSVFSFNEKIDRYLLKPVAQGYHYVTPSIVNNGITHIFSNIGEVPTTINALLQAKPKVAAKATLRLMINSTVGLLGFFDVATLWGVDGQEEDFSQTLAVWGVPTGAYIELPLLGPSTVRNAPSRLVDSFFDPVKLIDHTETYIAVKAVDLVDWRADLLDKEKLITGDRYLFIKQTYLQSRHYQELDGNVEDNFDQSTETDDDWMSE